MDRNRRIWIYLIFTHRTIWIEIGGYYNFCRYITHSVDIYDFYSWYNFDCLGLVVLLEKYNQRGPSIKKKICGIVSGGGGFLLCCGLSRINLFLLILLIRLFLLPKQYKAYNWFLRFFPLLFGS